MNTRIIVLGSEGFVGKHLCKMLKSNGIEFLGLDICGNPTISINVVKEFTNLKSIIKEFEPISIINLAAYANSSQCEMYKEQVYTLNVEFVERLAELCNELRVSKLIHASSEWIYGPGPIRVLKALDPRNFYARNLDLYSRSKLDSEIVLFKMSKQSDLQVYIHRFGIIYGTELNPSNCVVDYILKHFKSNSKVELRSKSSGRCFISVEDISYALIHSAVRDNQKQINKEPRILNIQGAKCHQLQHIIDFLYNNCDGLQSLKEISSHDDIKYINSDFESYVGRPCKSLENYLSLKKASV